jgi:hypothetical protein
MTPLHKNASRLSILVRRGRIWNIKHGFALTYMIWLFIGLAVYLVWR